MTDIMRELRKLHDERMALRAPPASEIYGIEAELAY